MGNNTVGQKPTFDFKRLMDRVGAPTAQVMAEICGLNRKAVHNRILRGIGWVEADELAIRCGFMPWEVWPEWELVDPTTWMKPVCRLHGNNNVLDLDDLSQRCTACSDDVVHVAA